MHKARGVFSDYESNRSFLITSAAYDHVIKGITRSSDRMDMEFITIMIRSLLINNQAATHFRRNSPWQRALNRLEGCSDGDITCWHHKAIAFKFHQLVIGIHSHDGGDFIMSLWSHIQSNSWTRHIMIRFGSNSATFAIDRTSHVVIAFKVSIHARIEAIHSHVVDSTFANKTRDTIIGVLV